MKIEERYSHILGKSLAKVSGGTMLDKDLISWSLVDGKWIGKRSVWTFDFRACWLENTTAENVKSWWCGVDADYTETFYYE